MTTRARALVSLGIAACCALHSHDAHALAPTYFNLRVPASACKPVSSTDRSKLTLSSGSWKFSSGSSGSASVICPVHFQHYDTLVYSSTIDTMRVWFNDSDGAGTDAYVNATLKRRGKTTGLSNVGTSLSSGSFGVTGNTRKWSDISHMHDTTYVYSVAVTLYRADSHTVTPELTGVDFCKHVKLGQQEFPWCTDDV